MSTDGHYKKFDIHVYYGGSFEYCPEMKYIEGAYTVLKNCQHDEMSLLWLNEVALKVGYKAPFFFYYHRFGLPLESGLECLKSDADTLEMSKIEVENLTVDVYIVGDIVEPNMLKNNIIDMSLISNQVNEDDLGEGYETNGSAHSFPDSVYNFSDDDQQKKKKNVDAGVECVNEVLVEGTGVNIERDLLSMGLNCMTELAINENDEDTNSDIQEEDLLSVDESENEKDEPVYKVFVPHLEMDDPIFVVGMLFKHVDELKSAIKNHGIKHLKSIRFPCSEPERLRVKCKSQGCSWFIYAKYIEEKKCFQIRSMQGRHTCGNDLNHKLLTSKEIARRFVDEIRMNTTWKVVDFQRYIHTKLGVNVSRKKIYRAFAKASTLIEGQFKDQYKRIYDYCAELRRTNPGFTVVIDTEIDKDTKEERFLRLYVGLEATIRGFRSGCRKVVGLDGCHLRGPHPGIMLTAVGVDANNCIYPIIYCVVETENKESWRWFLKLLVQDLDIYDQDNWVLVTDKQKVNLVVFSSYIGCNNSFVHVLIQNYVCCVLLLCPAIAEILPNIEHRHCVRHLYQNFKKKHGALALKEKLWRAAKATYVERFEAVMEEIKADDQGAYDWLAKEPTKYWTRSHFSPKTRCELLLNNLCECFNSAINPARDSSIIVFLEMIRIYMMSRLQDKREWIAKWDSLICPKIRKLVNEKKRASKPWISLLCGDNQFQVKGLSADQFIVDLNIASCSCRAWDLSGIPCVHAITAISHIGAEPEDYVAECYSKAAFERSYSPVIYPINGPEMWPKTGRTTLLAPKGLRLPGRPKMSRRKAVGEADETRLKKVLSKKRGAVHRVGRAGMKGKCSNCGVVGHNKRGCNTKMDNTIVENLPGNVAKFSRNNVEVLPVNRVEKLPRNGVENTLSYGFENDNLNGFENYYDIDFINQLDNATQQNRIRVEEILSDVNDNLMESQVTKDAGPSEVNIAAEENKIQLNATKRLVDLSIETSQVSLDVDMSNVQVCTGSRGSSIGITCASNLVEGSGKDTTPKPRAKKPPRCGVCLKVGHTKRTCTTGIAQHQRDITRYGIHGLAMRQKGELPWDKPKRLKKESIPKRPVFVPPGNGSLNTPRILSQTKVTAVNANKPFIPVGADPILPRSKVTANVKKPLMPPGMIGTGGEPIIPQTKATYETSRAFIQQGDGVFIRAPSLATSSSVTIGSTTMKSNTYQWGGENCVSLSTLQAAANISRVRNLNKGSENQKSG